MSKLKHLGLMALLACASSEATRAGIVDIQYTLSGGNVYGYTVHNNSLGSPLTDFVVYFPDITGPGEYTNLGGTVLDSPIGWTGTPFEPTAITLNGLVDWSTGGAGIPNGGVLDGFEISFNYSGSGSPGSQFFEVYDAGFNLLASGFTTPLIPEPASSLACAILLGFSVVGLRLRRTRESK